MKHLIFTSVFFFLFTGFLFAQPESDNHVGCRHAHQQAHVLRGPLTDVEKAMIQASAERSDTIDILDYTISLEVTEFSSRTIKGDCVVSFAAKMENIDYINLDLQTLTVDSVLMSGAHLAYEHDGLLLHVDLPAVLAVGEAQAIQVFYQGMPDTDPSDFGGFAFAGNVAYNLGIGLTSNPPNFGRSWFPCFDNFVERSTYEFNITSRLPNRAYCVGSFIEEVEVADNTIRRTYQMAQPIPTYLASVAISNYVEANDMHEGVGGMIPTQLVANPGDIDAMVSTFVDLDKAIDALEFWYGPYAWERVGYVSTPVGAMEHPTNIAYPTSSAVGGNTFGHRRLMAHELAHCWWGDVVTVGHARDMWVKEGNAEYGAHLMTEFAFGHEAFIDQVKDNHLEEVLIAAHIDDEGFHPLSNIPFEHIYGTHTYRKGAAMLHNMRGYLGDSLFRVGQRAVLDSFRFASADAYQYRDALTASTGYDMTSFFEDWILNPGFSAFDAIHSYTNNGGSYAVDLTLTQKVRAAPHLHTNVPLEITFINADGEKEMQQVVASGASTDFTLTSTIEPVYVTVNENNKLNMAHLSYQTTLDEVSDFNLPYVDLQLNMESLPQPAFIHVDHYWVAPDPIINNPDNAQISSTHYWRLIGDWEEGMEASLTFEYKKFLDEDLVGTTEEDIILVYRPDKNSDWTEYPYYNKLAIIPTDGNGFFRLLQILSGEYAFANGSLPMYTSTSELEKKENTLKVFPNPASTVINLNQVYHNAVQEIQLELINLEGKKMQQISIPVNGVQLDYQLSVAHLATGTYWLKLSDEEGLLKGVQQIEVIQN